jgi:uncharacterized protein YjiS (DUF1127 family)
MLASTRSISFPLLQLFSRVPSAISLAAFRLHELYHAIEGRHALGRMDDRMLADIGISRSQAQFEMSRKPWDVAPPANEQ